MGLMPKFCKYCTFCKSVNKGFKCISSGSSLKTHMSINDSGTQVMFKALGLEPQGTSRSSLFSCTDETACTKRYKIIHSCQMIHVDSKCCRKSKKEKLPAFSIWSTVSLEYFFVKSGNIKRFVCVRVHVCVRVCVRACVCVYHFTNFILKFLSDLKIVILGVNFVNDDIMESIFP
uniref:Uncharacterized protein n=1 Tax=Rousettus aegyptiacus TaxID=9407 RepID=A0A7J8JHP5_ROUAE|nr:hypothetical protein HJG63_010180 [Rousettus aegyptiacus]